jgi:voltage-gated potassium channel
VVAVGTFSAYILESDIPDSRIRDLGDAFWWALATVTTVGYGDVVPVTALGRAVGAVLMVSGIAILSVFISSLGAFLIKTAATPKTLTDEVKETIKKKNRQHRKPHTARSRRTTPDDQGPAREESQR